MEALKKINYSRYRVVALGMTGNLMGSIYENSLAHLKQEVSKDFKKFEIFGGVDWGDGKTKNASPTVALIGGMDLERGIEI